MTAEFAIVIPAVIVVAMLILSLTSLVVSRVQCQDAAREGARTAQTLQSSGTLSTQGRQSITAAAKRHSGPYGEVSISESAQTVHVEVACPIGQGPLHVFPAKVHANAYAVKIQEEQ